MKEELLDIIIMELIAIKELLGILEEQHKALLKSDAVTLESYAAKIENLNRKLAEMEVKRRQITKGRPMSEIVDEIGDNDLDKSYRDMKKLLEEVRVQKDSNDLLIKQGLSLTNRILGILNPSRTPKTYNSYGKVYR